MYLRTRKGFTILELMIVIAVIAIIVGIALPKFKGMRDEGNIARAKGELRTLQTGVESYRSHTNGYPTQLNDLVSANTVPNVVGGSLPYDPFGATNTTDYGYSVSGGYYVIYSVGANGDGTASVSDTGAVTSSNHAIFVSNGDPSTGG